MKTRKLFILSALLLLGLSHSAQAYYPRIGIGINFGVPVYRPWGCYPGYYGYPYYGWGYYHPVYVAPGPVVYGAAPVVVPPAAVVVGSTPESAPATSQNSPPPITTASPPTATPITPTGETRKGSTVDYNLQMLRSKEETVRRDAVMELGRMKANSAVDSLAATLAGDVSPTVRDAAARALGLIGSPRSLTALIRAAQADDDRDVRHSAQFAVEIIRANLKN